MFQKTIDKFDVRYFELDISKDVDEVVIVCQKLEHTTMNECFV